VSSGSQPGVSAKRTLRACPCGKRGRGFRGSEGSIPVVGRASTSVLASVAAVVSGGCCGYAAPSLVGRGVSTVREHSVGAAGRCESGVRGECVGSVSGSMTPEREPDRLRTVWGREQATAGNSGTPALLCAVRATVWGVGGRTVLRHGSRLSAAAVSDRVWASAQTENEAVREHPNTWLERGNPTGRCLALRSLDLTRRAERWLEHAVCNCSSLLRQVPPTGGFGSRVTVGRMRTGGWAYGRSLDDGGARRGGFQLGWL
jgi:hypothetical protein